LNKKTVSIGKLAKQFGLSRSTLLYYDRIGLLKPSARSHSNYRLYTKQDSNRLQQIRNYQATGIALDVIAKLLVADNNQIVDVLHQKLNQLNDEMAELRQQQQVIIDLLGNQHLIKSSRIMNKQRWIELLTACGMDDADMWRWHQAFEQQAPETHQNFLLSL